MRTRFFCVRNVAYDARTNFSTIQRVYRSQFGR
nr:MAG TPA: hypothetical protein [Caudoviricetes sp.]